MKIAPPALPASAHWVDDLKTGPDGLKLSLVGIRIMSRVPLDCVKALIIHQLR